MSQQLDGVEVQVGPQGQLVIPAGLRRFAALHGQPSLADELIAE
jgi:bifunctional DNA-binding transcriptional regulator/antitoxin component of YhaV-PrlF toxin-antitoxin module